MNWKIFGLILFIGLIIGIVIYLDDRDVNVRHVGFAVNELDDPSNLDNPENLTVVEGFVLQDLETGELYASKDAKIVKD